MAFDDAFDFGAISVQRATALAMHAPRSRGQTTLTCIKIRAAGDGPAQADFLRIPAKLLPASPIHSFIFTLIASAYIAIFNKRPLPAAHFSFICAFDMKTLMPQHFIITITASPPLLLMWRWILYMLHISSRSFYLRTITWRLFRIDARLFRRYITLWRLPSAYRRRTACRQSFNISYSPHNKACVTSHYFAYASFNKAASVPTPKY